MDDRRQAPDRVIGGRRLEDRERLLEYRVQEGLDPRAAAVYRAAFELERAARDLAPPREHRRRSDSGF